MGNLINRNEQHSNIDNKESFGIGKERSELTKNLDFRKTSSWSLGGLRQHINWTPAGSTKSLYSGSLLETDHKCSYRKNSKTVWPSSFKDSIFLPNFKRFSRNNEFNFENIIAKGAFGIVFKVTSKSNLKQIYALKTLRKSNIIEENAIQQIKDEVNIQNLCSHYSFITKYFDSWQNRSNLYILLEYIPCGELFKTINTFPYELIQLYVAEIASAIDFLHNAGVIYRDVKPENVLLTKNYHIKITDFGLSKWLKIGEQTRTMCGTFQYMAPEILIGTSYGHSVDWWALGVIACRMFTNKYPNTKKLVEEKHSFMIDQNLQDIPLLLPDIEGDLVENQNFLPNEVNALRNEGKDLLLRLLEYDPKKRIKSVMSLQKIAMYKNYKINLKSLLQISPIDIMKNQNVMIKEQSDEDLDTSGIFYGF